MKRLHQSISIVALVIATVLCRDADAANKWWDQNGTTANSGANGTSAAITGSFFATNAGGTSASTTLANGDVAIFSAGGDATGSYTVTGTITNSAAGGGLTVEEGTVVMAATVTLGANPVVVNSGAILSTDSSLRIGTTAGHIYTLNNGTLRTTNGGAAGSFVDADSDIVLNGGGTIDYTVPNVLNIIGTTTSITGTGPLTKTGVGVIAIASTAGTNTYTGGTVVLGGELRMRTVVNTLPVTTAMTVTSPGIFNLNGVSTQIGSLTGTGDVGTGSGTLTIDGAASTSFGGALKNIANAGAGAVTTGNGRLIKNGAGVITFNGINDIAGSVTLNAGGITVSSTGSLSGDVADLTVNGGTLTLNNAAEHVENFSGTGGSVVLAPAILTFDPIASGTYAGTISGAGGLIKQNELSPATTRTTTLSGNNSYDGNTIIEGGIISVQHPGALGSAVGYTEVNASGTTGQGAELLFTTAAGSVTTSEPLRIKGAGASNSGAIAVTSGASPTLSGPVTLIGDATLTVSGTSGVTYSNAAAITSLANQNLTLQGGALSTGTGGTISGAISLGTGSLTKLQGGTWTLSNAAGNTYSGGTTVTAGTLLVNNTTGSGTGSGTVTVNGGTLRGTGSVAGDVNVSSGTVGGTLSLAGNLTFTGGALAPGNSAGTVTMSGGGTVMFSSATALNYELNGTDMTPGGGVNDLLDGVGALTLDGTVNVTALPSGSFANVKYGDTWRLINYTVSLINQGLTVGTTPLPAGYSFVVDTSTFGQVNLVAIPEVSSLLAVGLVGLGSASVVWIRKKRIVA